ncbi:MAG: hypothetical protein IIW08_01995, partial [Clostridia bacterium]|nr:hypothetical protein [Clostridia bacterium]
LQNHPCICYWTIFNEGWGQFDADEVYEQFRKLDDTRITQKVCAILSKRKPHFSYSVNRNPLLLLLNALPERMQFFIIRLILSSK